MKSITINGSQRESLGKSSTKALRNAGKVPCVVYGGGTPIHFSANELEFNKLVYTPNIYTVDIKFDDGKHEEFFFFALLPNQIYNHSSHNKKSHQSESRNLVRYCFNFFSLLGN